MLAKLSNFSAIADAPLKKNAVLARQPVLHAGQTPAERFPDNAIPATSETPAVAYSCDGSSLPRRASRRYSTGVSDVRRLKKIEKYSGVYYVRLNEISLIGRDVVVSSLLASLSFSSCMYWAGDVPVNSLNAFRNPE